MTDPAAPPRPQQKPRRARWLDRVSLLLVLAGVAGATAAATAPLLRAAGVVIVQGPPPSEVPPRGSSAPPPGLPPTPPRGTGYAYDDHPRFAPDDAEPRVTELERLYPDGMWPGQRSRDPRDSLDLAPKQKPRSGHARSPLTVREKADVLANVSGRVPQGAAITVLLERGEWAFVAHRTEAGATVGWVARSAITVP